MGDLAEFSITASLRVDFIVSSLREKSLFKLNSIVIE